MSESSSNTQCLSVESRNTRIGKTRARTTINPLSLYTFKYCNYVLDAIITTDLVLVDQVAEMLAAPRHLSVRSAVIFRSMACRIVDPSVWESSCIQTGYLGIKNSLCLHHPFEIRVLFRAGVITFFGRLQRCSHPNSQRGTSK
jgi:hypothetical protein